MRALENEVVRSVAPGGEAAVGGVDEVFLRKQLGDGAGDGEASEARVENADRDGCPS